MPDQQKRVELAFAQNKMFAMHIFYGAGVGSTEALAK
jgi:hypothetical protein